MAQACTAFRKAAAILQGLAEDIKDEVARARFLAGPQICLVLQHAHHLAAQSMTDAQAMPDEG